MSVERIVMCDKCSKVVDTNKTGEEIFTIGLMVSHGIGFSQYDSRYPKLQEHRCIDCMIRSGLQQRPGKKDLEPAADKKLSLDDYIRELIREVLDEGV